MFAYEHNLPPNQIGGNFFLGYHTSLTLFRLGFLRVAQLGGGGGGGGVPAACNSKTINDNEMKFGGVVKDH